MQRAECRKQQKATTEQSTVPQVRWTITDFATILAIVVVFIARKLGWFHHHHARRFWLVIVVIVIGFWAGNLISLALIAGWAAEGIPWRLAPGLSAIAVSALLIPPLRKTNPYCNHLCPHGAIQQIVKPGTKSRFRIRISPLANRWLSRVPGAILAIAYVCLLLLPTVDLTGWEPFHAYLFRIAGWGVVLLAIASLVIATMIPMAYCRLGCPTGRLIDYLRRTATSDRIVFADAVAVGLFLLAITVNTWVN